MQINIKYTHTYTYIHTISIHYTPDYWIRTIQFMKK